MAIFNRLTRLFRADVHAVLDRLEEPAVLLRQAVREMTDEVAQHAQRLKARELDLDQTQARLAEIESVLRSSAGELDLCFGANNPTLLRTLLRRKLETERLAKHLTARLASSSKQIDEERRLLAEQQRQLESMQQKATLFESEPGMASGSEPARWSADDFVVTDADVDLALLREQQARGVS